MRRWGGEMSQTFSVSSKLPLTIRFPSGLKLTLVTRSECPLSVSVSWPVWASQTFSSPLKNSILRVLRYKCWNESRDGSVRFRWGV